MYVLFNNYVKNAYATILYKNSLGAHTKLEFDVLGVARKLVKYLVHLFKRKNCKNK
jgi:hypothetical protein